jgi:hypothetical protein
VTIHQERHPNLDVEGCFGCRIASVGIAASAMPSRHPFAKECNDREAGWNKDMPAFKAAVQNGVMPATLTGCAETLAMAKTQTEAEMMPNAVKLARKMNIVIP